MWSWFFLLAIHIYCRIANAADDIITYEQLRERNITNLYMIGDIHGALHSLLSACFAAQICNEQGEWIQPNCILVQVGDLIHRGPDSVGVARTLKKWQHDAQQYNSQVIVLRGNHEQVEISNASPMHRPTWSDPRDAVWYEFGDTDKANTSKQFLPGTELGDWIRSLPVIQIIGQFLFVHAGVHHEWLSVFDWNITAINEFARMDIRRTVPLTALNKLTKRIGLTKTQAMLNMMETRMLHPEFTSHFHYAVMPGLIRTVYTLNRRHQHLDLNVFSIVIGHNKLFPGQIRAMDRGAVRVVYLDTGFVDGQWAIAHYSVATRRFAYFYRKFPTNPPQTTKIAINTTTPAPQPALRQKTSLWCLNHLEKSGNFSGVIC